MIIFPEVVLTELVKKCLKSMGFDIEPDVKYAQSPRFGNLTTSVAMKLAGKSGLTPEELANKIIGGVKLPKFIQSVEVAKPGFINFKLTNKYLSSVIQKKIDLPIRKYCPSKKVLVEYSSPNIAKPFGVGHLRSTIIGDAVASAYASLGHKVTRINHIGDWGTQFGKLIFAYTKWGSGQTLEENPIKEMLNLYVRFHTEAELDPTIESKARYWFKKLEDGDEKAMSLWRKFSAWSMKEFARMYGILGVRFDEQKGESEYIKGTAGIIDELMKKGIATESEGALVVKFSDGTVPALLVKQDGASLYMTRDVAALRYRTIQQKADEVIYHVGSEQELHFKQLFKIAEMAKWAKPEQLVYAPHGLMRLPEGKMSTRHGKFVELEKLIDEAIERAHKIIEKKNPHLSAQQKQKVAHAVGVGAVKYNDLQNYRLTGVTFDWDKMLSFDGNSAPYIQYTYARLKSIARKTNARAKLIDRLSEDEMIIAVKLAQFTSVLYETAEKQAPSILAQYVFELSGMMSAYYEKFPIIKSEPKIRNHRLAIVLAGAAAIKQSLMILGIEAPEEI